ncbi:hypothetical protein ACS0TY_007925 [Phlomoides rotata]
MIILSWNCRGLGHPATIPFICELVRARRPVIIFLFETLSPSYRLEELHVKLGFDSCFNVDCIGHIGGISILWKASSVCSVLDFSQNHIDLKVLGPLGDWRVIKFYGFPSRAQRQSSWNLLRVFERLLRVVVCRMSNFWSTSVHGLEVMIPIMLSKSILIVLWTLGLRSDIEDKGFSLKISGCKRQVYRMENKRECEEELKRLQNCDDQASCDRYLQVRKELTNLLIKEEAYWSQRAKVNG